MERNDLVALINQDEKKARKIFLEEVAKHDQNDLTDEDIMEIYDCAVGALANPDDKDYQPNLSACHTLCDGVRMLALYECGLEDTIEALDVTDEL